MRPVRTDDSAVRSYVPPSEPFLVLLLGLTPIDAAVSKGEVEIAECLMKCGVEPFYFCKTDPETAYAPSSMLVIFRRPFTHVSSGGEYDSC